MKGLRSLLLDSDGFWLNFASGVRAVLDRLDPEPDGVQRRQEDERENRPAEGSADQGVGQRFPENGLAEIDVMLGLSARSSASQ